MDIAFLEPAHAAVIAFRWREIIARIQCPILLITGDPHLGAVVTPAAAQQAPSLWKQGEVVHIAGAGHNIRRDRYAEMMGAVKAFLNKAGEGV
jgi:pimeloyl-ACP methyl ester carboxylesterase